MLISEEYRRLNTEMHDQKPQYGTTGGAYKDITIGAVSRFQCGTILDWGSGKGTLKASLPVYMDVSEYDPAIPGKDSPPVPADCVVCTDVLEHIEPEHLEAVLDELRRLTLKAVVLVVHTEAANKHLPDGRNAHLTQEPYTWWLPKIWSRWQVYYFSRGPKGFALIGTP